MLKFVIRILYDDLHNNNFGSYSESYFLIRTKFRNNIKIKKYRRDKYNYGGKDIFVKYYFVTI